MNIESYILPLLLVLVFGYRYYSFTRVKKKLPVLLKKGAMILDVRTHHEFMGGHNPLSKNIPLNELSAKLEKLDKNQTIIVCCASGTRSAMAKGLLKKQGFKEVVNAGAWTNTLINP